MVERVGTLVGRAVASVVNLLDLPLAVVSGSVALGYGAPFFAAAQAEMELRCGLEFARGTRVVPGGLGDAGPLVGAARVGLDRLGLARVSGGQGRGQWGRDGLVVVRAVLPHPGLWWVALAALWRLSRRGWWRRPPFLPVPGDAYWRFRLVTVNGGDGFPSRSSRPTWWRTSTGVEGRARKADSLSGYGAGAPPQCDLRAARPCL